MPVINHKDIKDPEVFTGVFSRQLINKQSGGSASITVGELKIEPNCTLPEHVHFVEEALVVIEGEGTLIQEGKSCEIKSDMTVLMPAGQKHKIVNTGTATLKIYFSFPAVEVERVLTENQ